MELMPVAASTLELIRFWSSAPSNTMSIVVVMREHHSMWAKVEVPFLCVSIIVTRSRGKKYIPQQIDKLIIIIPFEFRRADEKAREPSNDSISIGDEYDVGEGTIGSIELNEVTNETVQPEYLEEGYHQAETSCSIDLIEVEDTLDPLTDDTAQPEYLEEEFQVEFQDVKEESFNMEPIRASLDNSDCVVTAAYFLEVQTDADEETETEIEK